MVARQAGGLAVRVRFSTLRIEVVDKFHNKYRVPSARLPDFNYSSEEVILGKLKTIRYNFRLEF